MSNISLGSITLSSILLITSLLLWPNSIGMHNPHQAFAQNSTMALDITNLLVGDAIQALKHKDVNGALEHLSLIHQHFPQAFSQNSTMAMNLAKLLANDAVQALNHKDINGALEHLKLIGQELEMSGNSTSSSKLLTHTHVHI